MDIVELLRLVAKDSSGLLPPIMEEAAAEIDLLRYQIAAMEIDRQPEPDLRGATFKAFGEEDDGHRNQ